MRSNPVELIRRKRDGGTLGRAEIEDLVSGYVRGSIPDYQFAAFLMAVYFKPLNRAEIADLTRIMLESGQILDHRGIRKPVIDKHSTGGVGDKVSLILAPLAAACGICVPMISGRGLGHTGGTLDKLEAIPGFRTNLTLGAMMRQLRAIGLAMIGQTAEIAPADKLMYALRDVTATVEAPGLIVASIMSKKMAEGLDGLVIDVKYGRGAFRPRYRDAKNLARAMIMAGRRSGLRVKAVLTDMNDPLGMYVGNGLEVIEAIEALKGRGPADLMEVTYILTEQMLKLAGVPGGRRLLESKIISGEALARFRALIRHQGGDERVLDDYERLPRARHARIVASPRAGYVRAIDTLRLGLRAVELGCGRFTKEDRIDPAAGMQILKKTGDRVARGEPLIRVISDDRPRAAAVSRGLAGLYDIRSGPCRKRTLVREVL